MGRYVGNCVEWSWSAQSRQCRLESRTDIASKIWKENNSQVGVRVTARDGFGDISVGDLRQDGAAYVNGAYGASPVIVYVTVAHGIGHVTLE